MHKNWRDLIKPKRVEVDEGTSAGKYAKLVIEPLERGFGVTLGNSLRRVLLSSLMGAAITRVKIDGVLHEFAAITGVKEDVSDVILSLKQVKLKIAGDAGDARTLTINAKGAGVVTAGDIQCGANVTVLNPDLHIATLSRDAVLKVELTAEIGRGYVPAELGAADQPVGTIPIDAIYNPVTRVNFEVSNARVGQRTDYDRLTLEVWTSGAVAPQDAVAIAAKIMKDQYSVFITFEDGSEEYSDERGERPGLNENLFKTVDELELSVRSANCLKNADIKYIGEMVCKTEQEMLKTKNFGRKSLNEIKELLRTMELDFGMDLPGFPGRKDLDDRATRGKDA